jgi:hypothetical protein
MIDSRFGDDCSHVATKEAIRRFGATPERLMAFLRWQCHRWDEWTDAGRVHVAEEYQWHISSTVETIRLYTGKSFENLASELGRVTGHVKPTLKVVLPDWVEERREEIVEHLRHRLPELSTRCSLTGYVIDEAVLHDFASWLESTHLFEVLFHYENLAKLNARPDFVARVGYAKEAVALATTVEHAVNALASEHVQVRGMTLLPKLLALWRGSPRVREILEKHRGLTSTHHASLEEQWTAIDAIVGGSGPVAVAKFLLRTVLIRNEGSHLGLAALPPHRVREVVGVLFDVIFLCWLEAGKQREEVSAEGRTRDSD